MRRGVNKTFSIRKLVNMRFKGGGRIEEHINEFQSVGKQLATMKMIFKNEMQALLLLSSL